MLGDLTVLTRMFIRMPYEYARRGAISGTTDVHVMRRVTAIMIGTYIGGDQLMQWKALDAIPHPTSTSMRD